MARRAAAFLTMLIILILAATLLWRVYRHHNAAVPYGMEPLEVRLDVSPVEAVKISHELR
jgi:hypothetical protein